MSDYNPNNRSGTDVGNGAYYFVGALVLIVGILGGIAFYGPPGRNLATAPDRSRETILPAPAPAVPATPRAAPLAPRQ
jgi:hypothetical protein